jgi:hypothetical protein
LQEQIVLNKIDGIIQEAHIIQDPIAEADLPNHIPLLRNADGAAEVFVVVIMNI